MSQDVSSATMANLLRWQHGTRFIFSHEFNDVLIGQMLDKLEEKDHGGFVLRRQNKGQNGEIDMWPDYSVNNYIYWPECLDDISVTSFLKTMTELQYHSTRWTM